MKLCICRLFVIAAFVSCFLGSAQTLAQKAYITQPDLDTVSVIATATNMVTATIVVGIVPAGVAVTPDGQQGLCRERRYRRRAAIRRNGIYEGTFNGNVTVSAGQDCIFLRGKITGNVNVAGGNFALNRAT